VPVPRKQHYVPRSYLANFTDSAGRLHVLDRDSGRQWESSPEKTACERDFYALEVTTDDEHDALGVESFFAQVEGHTREAIQATLREGCVPDGELRKRLMEFLAVQAVRVPGALRGLDDMADQIGKRVAWYLTATPETWAACVRRMKEAGDPVPDVPYEQVRESVLSEEYDVSWDQNTRLGMILRMLPQLAAVLSERKWTLVVAGNGCPDFVCSDRPLTVSWNEPPAARRMPPGLGLGNTTAQIPLGRRAALLGMFERPFPMTTANPMLVGLVNMGTITYATRYVYSAKPDFSVVLPNGRRGGREDVVRRGRE
jgi:uncharacterized protein DUF4238